MEYLDVPPQGIADSEVHIAVVSDGPSKPLGGELLQQDLSCWSQNVTIFSWIPELRSKR